MWGIFEKAGERPIPQARVLESREAASHRCQSGTCKQGAYLFVAGHYYCNEHGLRYLERVNEESRAIPKKSDSKEKESERWN